ncbi:carotenoid oxygenase family protein [Variovorax sp. KK3]|uniref:carotenoid oxygenase family protein n=1 Tax=Variovorax sp. KK3 TaxID=1855728 RepID=UPI0015C39B7B|nr:carotenoid oxygenase family protein [Variovorax sp. KK3]
MDNPFLSGNYKPVLRETDARDLKVAAGHIPEDLRGVYMRNGPNPMFRPIHYAYPLDGDGMIHAVYLDGGKARYRNRFVDTASLAVERRAGRAVYGSFTHPEPIDPALFLDGENTAPIKNGAFVNIIRHGEHLLALNEATICYEMNEALDTLGPWTAGTAQPVRLGAHNKRHPRTGDLHAIQYTWREPIVKFHRFSPAGLLMDTLSLDLPMPTMVHDFVLTERHLVLIAGPAVFDVEAMQAGRSMLQWRPDLGMRIAIVPLDGAAPTWIEGDPFFVYHFANGFERSGQIVVDYVHYEKFSFEAGQRSTLRRMTIDPVQRRFDTASLLDEDTEFPRINHLHEALATRYVYLPVASGNNATGGFDALARVDTETGAVTKHDFGRLAIGEAAFVPRPGGTREDDGYLATFAYDAERDASSFVLLDAGRIDDEPVAVVELPQRVPYGLHGNWIAGTRALP